MNLAPKNASSIPVAEGSRGGSIDPRDPAQRKLSVVIGGGRGGTLTPTSPRPRRFGALRHLLISMSDDFDAPLADFAEYAP